ncbi:aminoglycoside phosphotransferase family protein [Paenibacillus sp. L3-i20]|uniref:aminoglycoside phosphotransferase family protein n=1 Tax=Paenibacillus sp. L3-i20 TaxID=2905833 RepID=UPI001EDCCE87|nr:aminoglycoside phosphotransferase family protein [Paenibacillus sp. L3-i20]GKU78792.1 hypothetical protein L3i20_v231890 [Paenibacillus sp. L3-i20]
MKTELFESIENVIGKVNTIVLLDEQGCTSEVSRIVTDEKPYILKSANKEKYREWLKNEAHILEKLRDNSIPLPRYFGFFEQLDSSHLLMSFEEGVTLTYALTNATLMEKKKLLRSFGRFLNHFHESSPLNCLEHEGSWLDIQLEKAKGYVDSGQCDGDSKLLNSLISNKPLPVNQTMIHGDCTTDNVLVKDGEISLFIDVAGMTVGDPRYDESLAISDLIDEPELLEAFYEGYTRYRVTMNEFKYFNEGLYEFF